MTSAGSLFFLIFVIRKTYWTKKMNYIPKVSILIPCYNVEKYISDCLDSVINQTLKDIEIICINDGSTDNTYNILCNYQYIDKRITIINKSNSGYGNSMNIALSRAHGQYIGIVESDDFVELNMFETLYKIAIKKNTEITRSCYYEFKDGVNTLIANNDVPKNKVITPNIEQNVFWQAPSIWAAIYKREWLQNHKIKFLNTPGASYQDTSFTFKCYTHCNRFIMIDTPLIHYRVDNPKSSIHSKNKAFAVCNEWDEIYNFISCNKQYFHLYNIAQNLEFCTYAWNFKRLSGFLRYKFLFYWFYKIIIHLFKGEINFNKIDSKVVNKIKKYFLSKKI